MKKKRRTYLGLAAVAAAVITISAYYALESEDWQVWSPQVPEAFDGLRITLLTDLHGRELGENSRRLIKAVQAAKPDLIAISGDLADESTDRSMLDPLLKSLCKIAPTYYVAGNHEWRREDRKELMGQIAGAGVTVLSNSYVTLVRGDASIVLAGTEDPNGYRDMITPKEFMEQIRQEQADPYVVMLYHRNNSLELWSGLDADLVLAGHGHGGVIRLPFVGGLLSVDRRFFPKDAEGLYHRGDTTLAVSRGLGGVRMWNPSHLPTIVLKSGVKP